MNKKIKILTSAVLTAMLISSTAYANPSTSDYENAIESGKKDLEEAQGKRDELERKLEAIDNEISTLMVEIERNQDKIQKTETQIVELEAELEVAKAKLEETRQTYNDRMVSLYKQSGNEYLSILFSSKSLSELINNMDYASRVTSYTNDIIAQMEEEQRIIEENEKKLKDDRETLENTKITLEANKKVSESKQEESKTLLSQLNQEIASLSQSIEDNQKKLEEETRRLLEEAKKKAAEEENARKAAEAAKEKANGSGNGTSSGNSTGGATSNNNSTGTTSNGSATGQKIVNRAMDFLGLAYVWGGTTPAGFDCSGLVQYVYREYGITTGRTTWDQIKKGVGVDKSNLQLGDLVFFGKGGDPTHVGIYVGNGNYIHAPRTGDVIKISALSGRSDYITARRLL